MGTESLVHDLQRVKAILLSSCPVDHRLSLRAKKKLKKSHVCIVCTRGLADQTFQDRSQVSSCHRCVELLAGRAVAHEHLNSAAAAAVLCHRFRAAS